jgi:hypothetical protein
MTNGGRNRRRASKSGTVADVVERPAPGAGLNNQATGERNPTVVNGGGRQACSFRYLELPLDFDGKA